MKKRYVKNQKGKTIYIPEDLEKAIVDFCNDECIYHIFESGCADQYGTEIKAQIKLLRLLGYDDKATLFENAFNEWMEEYIYSIKEQVNEERRKKI